MMSWESASARRKQMVDTQLRARGICLPAVLDAMERVPREAFMSSGTEALAFEDGPVPIEEGQTISQPYVVAYMVEALRPCPHHRVLEIGTGSGYAAAVLACVVREVFTLERYETLAGSAAERLRRLGYANVHVAVGDGSEGWEEHAPYDGIIVSAGAPAIPEPLLDQLADGGTLVVPVGSRDGDQQLVRVVRRPGGRFDEDGLGLVRFVPLIGRHGWSEGSSWLAW